MSTKIRIIDGMPSGTADKFLKINPYEWGRFVRELAIDSLLIRCREFADCEYRDGQRVVTLPRLIFAQPELEGFSRNVVIGIVTEIEMYPPALVAEFAKPENINGKIKLLDIDLDSNDKLLLEIAAIAGCRVSYGSFDGRVKIVIDPYPRKIYEN